MYKVLFFHRGDTEAPQRPQRSERRKHDAFFQRGHRGTAFFLLMHEHESGLRPRFQPKSRSIYRFDDQHVSLLLESQRIVNRSTLLACPFPDTTEMNRVVRNAWKEAQELLDADGDLCEDVGRTPSLAVASQVRTTKDGLCIISYLTNLIKFSNSQLRSFHHRIRSHLFVACRNL